MPNTDFVLAYHRITEIRDALQPDVTTVKEFESSLKTLSNFASFIPAEAILEASGKIRQVRPRIAVTFDDGYKDSVRLAQPILKRLNIPCTIFITTGFSKEDPYFVDAITHAVRMTESTYLSHRDLGPDKLELTGEYNKRIALNQLLGYLKYLNPVERDRKARELCETLGVDTFPESLLSAEEIQLAHTSGIRIGAHTHRHAILSTLSDDEAAKNIKENKDYIRSITGHEPNVFAYPNGKPNLDFNTRHESILQSLNFKLAFTSESRPITPSDSLLSLPRYSPWQRFRNHLSLKIMLDTVFN